MSRFNEYLTEDKANTEFLETASCIGIICYPGFATNLKKFIDGQKGDAADLLAKVQKIVGSGSHDWNKKGVSEVKSLSVKNPAHAGKIATLFSLIVGMNMFMQDFGYKVVGTKPSFVHDSIKKYYKIESEKLGGIPYAKANTTDCVICSGSVSDLFKGMQDGIETDDSEKFAKTASGIKYIQVSLKKSLDDALLGKVTKYVRNLYDLESEVQASKRFITDSTIQPETNPLDEGIWDNIKAVGAKVFGKLKSALGGFISKVFGKFNKVNTSHVSEFEKAMGINEAFFRRDTKTEDKLIESVIKKPERAVNIVNNEIKKLQMSVTNSDIVMKVKVANKLNIKSNIEVFKILGNYLSVKAIQEMVADEKMLKVNIAKIIGEMFFGSTKLPLWKVYGYYGGGGSYQFLGTIETFSQKKLSEEQNVEIMGVDIHPQDNSYYTIVVWILDEVSHRGKKYIRLRTGTNSNKHISFIIEGTKEYGPYPFDKPLAKII